MESNEAKGFYKLSWLQRIGFGAGDLAQNLIYQTICMYLLFFYTDVYVLGGEAAESAEDKLRLKVGEKIEQIKSLEMKVEALQNVNAKKEDTILAYSKEAEKMVERINGLKESAIKHWNDLQAAKAKLDEKEDEIIRLKAKLYDLMAK